MAGRISHDSDEVDLNDTAVSTSSSPMPPAPPSDEEEQDHQHPRTNRGRYAKFTASMDILLLEALKERNPLTAKHGTRLQLWQTIAEMVGKELLQDPHAYSWHTCRDRVATLMKLHADGRHDKLYKHGSLEENERKDRLLREMEGLIPPKQPNKRHPNLMGSGMNHIDSLGDGKNRMGASKSTLISKRRRVDPKETFTQEQDMATESFRRRVLELMETKLQLDMERAAREQEMRAIETELHKRFLAYLQTK